MLNVGSLFAGIGGFDLGLERAGGFRTAWFCERDAYCQRVLAKHWPDVPCYDDVCALTGAAVAPVDVLCGGFPCQDISVAGHGAGLAGARSGLWSEYARLIGELRPRYVIVENVSALLARGMGTVLGDLAALGYDAEWDCLPASAFGAPHQRDRVWLVAYPDGSGFREVEREVCPGQSHADRRSAELSDPTGPGLEGREQPTAPRPTLGEPARGRRGRGRSWPSEPDVGRVAHGVPDWVDRIRSLGNALVPQIAEWIGGRVMAYEADRLEGKN